MAEADADSPTDPNPRPREDRPGYRIGPLVFVPSVKRSGDDDPWAHRKGEPRIFALLWCGYLMAASLATVLAVRGAGPVTARQYEFGALGFITLAAIGAVLLFPMVRLSQTPPPRPIRAIAVDCLVVLLPIHVVIWPMPLITRWPLETSAALATAVTAWTLLAASLAALGLAVARRREPGRPSAARAWATAAIVLSVTAAPLIDVASRPIDPSGLGNTALVLSPITAPWVLAIPPAENLTARVAPEHWPLLIAPAVGAFAIVLLTGLFAAFSKPASTGVVER